jgi:hypothetical protein
MEGHFLRRKGSTSNVFLVPSAPPDPLTNPAFFQQVAILDAAPERLLCRQQKMLVECVGRHGDIDSFAVAGNDGRRSCVVSAKEHQ